MERPRKRLKEAKTVAVGCDQLPEAFHGKEGVSGSSPEEGFEFLPAWALLPLSALAPIADFGVHRTSTSVHRGRCAAARRNPQGRRWHTLPAGCAARASESAAGTCAATP
jgi:hypothetical protein